MNCPFCGYHDSKVIDSRPSEEKIRRRRECLDCGKRFTSYEVVERLPLMVIKRDLKREPFDRDKLIQGLLRATKKRPIALETLESLIDDLKIHYANLLIREVTSDEIGENILSRLKEIDLVAYVRFASVYRDFNDIDSFMKIITEIKQEND
ncbi:MAG TPA: transcriptional regulator NrdR [Oscillospiraceae bacterium]|nr:transcriptional regulator NrdR [Oscillospiraceae bacterium]